MVKQQVPASKILVSMIILLFFALPSPRAQETGLPLFTFIEKKSTPLFAEDLKAFVDSKPSETDYLPVLTGLCIIYEPDLFHLITMLRIVKKDQWEALKPQLPSLLDSENEQVRAVARLIAAELPDYNQAPSKHFPRIEQALTARDDWEAFSIYRCAAKRGERLSDEQFLACIDDSRPSLAAAVIEDRFHGVYRKAGEKSEAELLGKTDFIDTLMQKCVTLHKGDDPRLVIPPLYTVIHFGKASAIEQYIFLVDSPFPVLRNLAYTGLLRYADTSLYRYFIKGINDENINVRILCIKGLGAIRDSRAIGPLAKMLKDDSEPGRVRTECAKALGEIGDRRIVSIFRSFLLTPRKDGKRDANARAAAAHSLGQLREKTAVDALIANIDTEKESSLNYECIIALGKIRSTTGFEKLFPLVKKGWDLWYKTAYIEYHDNAYASLWALFPYRTETVINFYRDVFESIDSNGAFDVITYTAAYYLLHAGKTPQEEALFYVENHRQSFFKTDYRVYEFAATLKGRWDIPSLRYLADNIESYGSTTQTWILSSIEQQAYPEFFPVIAKVRESPGPTVRKWAARLLWIFSTKLSSMEKGEAARMRRDIISLVESWDNNAGNKDIDNYLDRVEKELEKTTSKGETI